ncbi:hypothetical protein K435DRAFT_778917, partial [Dendrothele bispora CBS 962.96]
YSYRVLTPCPILCPCSPLAFIHLDPWHIILHSPDSPLTLTLTHSTTFHCNPEPPLSRKNP